MKITWKNTVFLRIFLMFLLIIAPIIGIAINIYNWGVRAIQDEIYKSMIAQVTFYLDGLDTEIQGIKQLQYECISDDDLNSLTFAHQSMNNYEKTQAFLRLQRRLITIKSSSRYIDDASISIIEINTDISVNNGIQKGIDEDLLKSIKSQYVSPHSQMSFWNGSFYLNVTNSWASKNKDKISYAIRIKLKENAFLEDLNQFNTYEDSMSMMTCKSGEFVLIQGKNSDSRDVMMDMLAQKVNKSGTGTYNEKVNDSKYLAIYSTSNYLNFSVARYIPAGVVFSRLYSYRIWLWVFAVVSLVIIILFSFSIYGFIHKPLKSLVKAFKDVESGDLKVHIEHRHNDEFMYLYKSFNTMVGNLGTLFDQVYKQKILMQNAQLKQLQAQINPHFLYNTFFILYSIARTEDYENVMSFLQQLGSYFKFITRNSEDEVILSMEVEHARTYTNIQALRFSRRIVIKFEELPEKFKDVMVPRLIIQPIIENSFKYGLEDKASNGVLIISFHESGRFLRIIIEDNGNGMNSEDMIRLKSTLVNSEYEGEATGIVNIHKRLQLKFGKNSGLEILKSEIGGLSVVISLELKGDGDVQTTCG